MQKHRDMSAVFSFNPILKVKLKGETFATFFPPHHVETFLLLYRKLCKPLHDFLQSNRFK